MEELTPIEQLLTVKDVAGLIRSSTSWVYKAAEVGTIPCVRIGAMLRFKRTDIQAWLDGRPPVARSVKLPGSRG